MRDHWFVAGLCCLAFVLICTLFPFRFHPPVRPVRSVRDLIVGVGPDRPFDVLENVVLFVPLGFTLTGLLFRKGFGGSAVLLGVLVFSVALSYGIEIAQVFLPGRFSSLTDVFANGAGAAIGSLSARFCVNGAPHVRWRRHDI